jgi:hypothetical protein
MAAHEGKMRTIFFLLGIFALMTGTFFGSAGRWDLPLAWTCLSVYAAFMVLAQIIMTPELRRERMKPAPGGIDRQIRWAMLPFIVGFWVLRPFHTVGKFLVWPASPRLSAWLCGH